VHVVSREQAYRWVVDGMIDNAASIIALQWLQLNYSSLRNEWNG
ncbi:MAG: ADP-ribose diphosphatase, partial [Budvicia sp.]|nr:ADP-ribose diphosphatase [Budvicia sp.]